MGRCGCTVTACMYAYERGQKMVQQGDRAPDGDVDGAM